jgi:hypothetical protein
MDKPNGRILKPIWTPIGSLTGGFNIYSPLLVIEVNWDRDKNAVVVREFQVPFHKYSGEYPREAFEEVA